jgi:archaellin
MAAIVVPAAVLAAAIAASVLTAATSKLRQRSSSSLHANGEEVRGVGAVVMQM